MTIDERIERLEFLNAAYVEQRRKDWEEYLIRERDLKSHIDAIWLRMERRDREWDARFRDSKDDWDARFEDSRNEYDRRSREQGERIDRLVVAIGELCQKLDK